MAEATEQSLEYFDTKTEGEQKQIVEDLEAILRPATDASNGVPDEVRYKLASVLLKEDEQGVLRSIGGQQEAPGEAQE